ncbi:MAG: LacI family DNA-binding transcriptional regulator [Spirochaetales bacterium]|nr:LacI family DNA-binding transcriptional regulator [Spirochaetales bacterium]
MKIADIAKEAGVSIGTVDRVLHNRGRVSKETKAKIEKIIKDSGYKPNIIASNLKKNKSIKIGILIPKLSSEGGYWDMIYNGINRAMAEITQFPISTETREFDRTIRGDYLEKGKELINEGIDVLAMAPVVQSEAYQVIASLKDIPYAFFDSSLPEAHPITENLQNSYKAGWCAAKIMNVLNPDASKFVCLQMHSTAYNLQQRAKGFTDYFETKNVDIVNLVWDYKNKKELFLAFFDSVINENPDAAGYFIPNDATSKIAYRLKEKLSDKMPTVIGFDLLEDNKKGLREGVISVLISQQPENQGYNTIREIFQSQLLNQHNTTQKESIPIDIIIKENLPEG